MIRTDYVLCAAVLIAASVFGQSDAARHVHEKGSLPFDARYHDPHQVVVKTVERAERTNDMRTRDFEAVRSTVGARAIRPFFAGLETQLDALDARIASRIAAGELAEAGPDLRRYYVVETTSVADTKAMLDALNRLDAVELAYPRELPTPPPGDVPPLTPSFVASQGYRGVAPGGFDVFSGASVAGSRGDGITVLDIEWSWRYEHEDLGKLRASSLVGPKDNGGYADHGVSVIGELAGDEDAWGISGMTPEVTVRVASDYPFGQTYSVARAIVTGLPVLKKGDVMLLEAQTYTPLGLGPTEWIQADFDAIVNATKAGVIVVEAGGNGGVNLDSASLNGRFDLTKYDSGALIVGASDSNSLSRASFSVYGSRIDANGWGSTIVSSGYGDLFDPTQDGKQDYTSSFGGTSGASPMVTSTIAMLLAASRAQLAPADADKFVDHKYLRALLRQYGTAMNANQGISLRPDWAKLLVATKLVRGLELLDPPMIGKSMRLRITADFTPTPRDAWLLMFAPNLANIAVPGMTAPCDRLLLDLATLVPAVAGVFPSGNAATQSIVVPNDKSLEYASFYWQAVTLDTTANKACLTSAAQTRLRM
ncbi:MAG: S8 family serine peptidase [Planctomycetes bacterium]|nr:S8 family serine peptidase [Planctomycetota bacterium]